MRDVIVDVIIFCYKFSDQEIHMVVVVVMVMTLDVVMLPKVYVVSPILVTHAS